jgi:ribokinase
MTEGKESPSERDHRGHVLALGSIGVDFHMVVEQPPAIGKTVAAQSFRRLSGGKAANVAFLASKLGADARLFAHVGDDDLAEYALRPLRDIGVNLSGVHQMPHQETGVTMVTVTPDGRKGFVTAENANKTWNETDADDVVRAISSVPGKSALVVDCQIRIDVVEKVMRAAKHRGLRLILDPSPAVRVTDSLLALAEVVTPNASEAQTITGIECKDVAAAARAGNCLLKRGVSMACIKLPGGGCVLVYSHGAVHIASAPVQVVDTTGAGDAFAAAFAVALIEGRSCVEAARFAVAASNLAVTGLGAQPAYPSREDIERMMQRLVVNAGPETQD